MITVPLGDTNPYFYIKCKEFTYCTLNDIKPPTVNYEKDKVYELKLIKNIEVEDDVLVECLDKGIKEKKLFWFWFNTRFVGEDGILVIRKKMLDKAYHDKNFDKNFRIELELSPIIPMNSEQEKRMKERLLNITESMPFVYKKLSIL